MSQKLETPFMVCARCGAFIQWQEMHDAIPHNGECYQCRAFGWMQDIRGGEKESEEKENEG